GVIERDFDRHHASVGNQAMGALHAIDAAPRSGHADRAALVAADRHIHLAGGDDDAAAGGRAAGRITHFAGLVHRTGRMAVAAAGETEILAMGLADDGAAR